MRDAFSVAAAALVFIALIPITPPNPAADARVLAVALIAALLAIAWRPTDGK